MRNAAVRSNLLVPEIREVMDIRQASDYLGISPDTLYKYASEGFVPAFKLGNRWRFKRSRLDEWMDGNPKCRLLSPRPIRTRRNPCGPQCKHFCVGVDLQFHFTLIMSSRNLCSQQSELRHALCLAVIYLSGWTMYAASAQLRRRMTRAGLSGLLVTHLPDVRYLSGFTGSSAALAVTRRAARLFTDGRYKAQAAEEVKAAQVEIVSASPAISAVQWLAAQPGVKFAGFDPTWTTVAELSRWKAALPSRLRRMFLSPLAGAAGRTSPHGERRRGTRADE